MVSQPSVFRQVFSLSKDSIIYGLSTVLSQFVGFLLVPLYTDKLGTQGYGVIEVLSTTAAVLGIILAMGVGTAMMRFYAGREDEEGKKRVASTAVIFLAVTGLVALVLLELAAGPLSRLILTDPYRDRSHDTFYFRILFASLFLNGGVDIALTVFRARGAPVRYAMASVTQFLMTVTLNIVFVLGLNKGLEGVLFSQLITAGFLYVVLMGALLRRVGITVSRRDLKAMLDYGLPLIPSGLGAWILVMADRFILMRLMGAGPTGVYSLGYKFGMVVQGILVGPIQLAWLPFLFSSARKPGASQTYTRVFTYFLAVALFAALALSALGEELVLAMATPPFHNAYNVIPLVALSYVLYGCYFQMAAGIYIEGKTRNSATIMMVGAVVNVGLCYALIPHFGIMGAAVATLVSYALLPVGAYFFAQRYYPITYEWGRVVKMTLAAAVIFTGCLAVGSGARYYLARSTDDDGILQAGETWTWTYSHNVTQAEIDSAAAGSIDCTATVASKQLGPRSDTECVPVAREAGYTIRLTVTDVAGDGPGGLVDAAEDVIAYRVVVANTGAVPLSDIKLADTLVDLSENFTLRKSSNGDDILDVGESWTWTYWYTTTVADKEGYGGEDGDIDNTATVSCAELPSRSDSREVPVYGKYRDAYRITLDLTDVGGDGPDGLVDAAGEVITCKAVVANVGDYSLTEVSLADSLTDVSGVAPVESGAAGKWPRVLIGGGLKVLLILAFPLLLLIIRFFRPDELALIKSVLGAIPGMAAGLLRRKRPPAST